MIIKTNIIDLYLVLVLIIFFMIHKNLTLLSSYSTDTHFVSRSSSRYSALGKVKIKPVQIEMKL